LRFRLIRLRPTIRQVMRMRIHRLNQANLLAPASAFDFFFSVDGFAGMRKTFVVDRPSKVVAPGESRDQLVLMFKDSPGRIAGHCGI
jgi:hypothetical protein